MYATESSTASRITFVNEPKGIPDLYVGKEVEIAEGCTTPRNENDTFTFTLLVNDKPAKGLTYKICDLNWKELTKEELGVHNSFSITNGTFTLKAGQAAKISGIDIGSSYTVSEVEKKNYDQIIPANGGSVTGEMTSNGAETVFKNLYNPSGKKGAAAKIEVVKTIEFPTDYTPPTTPDFKFKIKVNGAVYAGKPYKIRAGGREYNAKDEKGDLSVIPDGATVSGNRLTLLTTGQDGSFTLKGNQTAIFENSTEEKEIYVGTEYEVQELATEGWTAIGATSEKNEIKSPLARVAFHNSEVSFMVTKELAGPSQQNSPEFTFELLKDKTTLWGGAKYYLYEKGTLITEGAGPDGKRETRADGTFDLKANQAAIFVNMPADTTYHVREVGNAGYIQTFPLSTEGHTDQEIVRSPITTLSFINQKVEKGLTVTKLVENMKGDAPDKETVYHFVLRKKDVNGVYQPVEDADYKIKVGGSEYTYKTSKKDSEGKGGGEFTLKVNETARFETLLPGDYQVEEIDLPLGYEVEGENPKKQTYVRGQSVEFNFTNQYWSDKTDLTLIKQNPSGQPLEGAEFRLLKAEFDEAGTTETGRTEVGTGTTSSDGTLSFSEPLTAGTWYLEETMAPFGYQLLEDPIKIEITWDADNKWTVTPSGAGLLASPVTSADKPRTQLTLTLKNEYLYALPSTGGMGTAPYTVVGLLLISIAGGMYLYLKKRQKEI